MRRAFVAASIVLSLLVGPDARADECGSYGAVASLRSPEKGGSVPVNGRFSVELWARCGEPEGPDQLFRVMDERGDEIRSKTDRARLHENCRGACARVEIIPSAPMTAGTTVRLEVRSPSATEAGPNPDGSALGPWAELARFTVRQGHDTTAPRFDGIVDVSLRPVEGLVGGPCIVSGAWELEARFEISPADDGPYGSGELLYFLDRQLVEEPHDGDAAPWEFVFSFQPERSGAAQVRHGTYDWVQTFRYRARVRDAAGNEAIGTKSVVAKPPTKPASIWDEQPGDYVRGGGAAKANAGCASCVLGAPAPDSRGRDRIWAGGLLALWLLALRRRRSSRLRHH